LAARLEARSRELCRPSRRPRRALHRRCVVTGDTRKLPVFVAHYAVHDPHDGHLVGAVHRRVSAPTLADAEQAAADALTPGWTLQAVREADVKDRQAWL